MTTIDVIELSSERLEEEGHTQRYRLRIPEDLLYFQGHFEDDPLLPAVVQLDTLLCARVEQLWPELGPLTSASRLKFKVPIRPGDEIEVTVRRADGAQRVQFSIQKEGEVCASGALKFE